MSRVWAHTSFTNLPQGIEVSEAREELLATHEFVEQEAHRVDVAAGVYVLINGLLGRNVGEKGRLKSMTHL